MRLDELFDITRPFNKGGSPKTFMDNKLRKYLKSKGLHILEEHEKDEEERYEKSYKMTLSSSIQEDYDFIKSQGLDPDDNDVWKAYFNDLARWMGFEAEKVGYRDEVDTPSEFVLMYSETVDDQFHYYFISISYASQIGRKNVKEMRDDHDADLKSARLHDNRILVYAMHSITPADNHGISD